MKTWVFYYSTLDYTIIYMIEERYFRHVHPHHQRVGPAFVLGDAEADNMHSQMQNLNMALSVLKGC